MMIYEIRRILGIYVKRLRGARVQYTYLYLLTCYGLGDTKAILQTSYLEYVTI